MVSLKKPAFIDLQNFCSKEDKRVGSIEDKIVEIVTSAGNFRGNLLTQKQVRELFGPSTLGMSETTITLKDHNDDDEFTTILIEEIIAFKCFNKEKIAFKCY